MKGIRLNFIVEGQTEEAFVNRVLNLHLANSAIWASARCVMTGHKGGIKYRGGITSYERAKRDITQWIKEDRNKDARFTTMFDLYGLPDDFPGYEDSAKASDPYERVGTLERALEEDIGDPRFIAYIQLHEFEALLLSDPQKLDLQFYDRTGEIERLVIMVNRFNSPELIDDGIDTSPSKRIIAEIPEYAGMKVSASPIIAERIGLQTLRTKCEHFDKWLDKLESLM